MGSVAAVRAIEPAPAHVAGAVAYRQAEPCLSPLRYPGAKRRMVGYVADVLIHNQLRPDLFVELFAGGSSVSIQLLHDGLVENIGLVDLDRQIAAFWATVFHDSAWLLEQIADIPLDLDHWRAFRAVQHGSRRELALACLYLNRTSFSGILADRAGPLGGTKEFDADKFACRFPRETLARRVRHLATHREKVKFIWSRDWSAAVRELTAKRRTGSLEGQLFYFVDPPFFHKAERLYRHSFTNASAPAPAGRAGQDEPRQRALAAELRLAPGSRSAIWRFRLDRDHRPLLHDVAPRVETAGVRGSGRHEPIDPAGSAAPSSRNTRGIRGDLGLDIRDLAERSDRYRGVSTVTFLDAIENKTKAGSPLAVLINDDCPSIGGIYNLDYGRAIVLTDDFRKSEAGGVPLGGYLLAAAGNQTDDGFVLDDEELVLLRVRGTAPLPNESDLVQTRLAVVRDATNLGKRFDEVTDVLTRNELQQSAFDCEVIGTYFTPEPGSGTIDFGADIDNVVASAKYQVFLPSKRVLSWLASYPETHADDTLPLGTVRFSSTTRTRPRSRHQ